MGVVCNITDSQFGVFHLHSNYSDGELTIRDIAKLARQYNWKNVALLDHACLSGCVELAHKLRGSNISVLLGYEHTIGNTDIAVFGEENILPGWWSIEQIAETVHGHGGAIIYLHPMRGDRAHLDELREWITRGFVNGWEWRNNLDTDVLPRSLCNAPSVWGIDLHDRKEVYAIPPSGMRLPSFLARYRMMGNEKLLHSGFKCPVHEQFVFSFGRVSIDIIGGRIELSFCFDVCWGDVNELDVNGDCIEIVVPSPDHFAFARLVSLAGGFKGVLQSNSFWLCTRRVLMGFQGYP